jgi:hypothetical protein
MWLKEKIMTNSMMSPVPDPGNKKISADLNVAIMAQLIEQRVHDLRSEKLEFATHYSPEQYSKEFLTIKFDGGRRWGHSTLAALLAQQLSFHRPLVIVPNHAGVRQMKSVGINAVALPTMVEKIRGYWYDLVIVDDTKFIAQEDLDALPVDAIKILLA